ncbi:MAG: HAMP domain-containing protein [Actinobacteria bacterium]|nr:HAMP domain-containing protein [Actinomycetota bacterium]
MRLRSPRPPRRTVRFRLTAVYSGLFLAAGAALLAFTYALMDRTTSVMLADSKSGKVIATSRAGAAGTHQIRSHGTPTAAELRLAGQLRAQAVAQHAHYLHQLLIESGIALSVMAGLAIALGWLVAGRVLRPLRAMTAATQQITERNLHQRLALPGPGDEVKDLADTIDHLLGRLEAAFEAQRRFVASASHELRTPLTLNRALLEVALADPAASAGDLRGTCEELLSAGEQQERLVEALLTLATTERGLDRAEEFDLAETTGRALAPYRAQARRHGLRLAVSLGHAVVRGDPDLAERMAANLIDNAIRYNIRGGSVDVRTQAEGDHVALTVANTGPPVPAGQAGQLLEPFQRLVYDRAGHPDGHGLGLSIVASIAAAHDASLEVQLPSAGGLTAQVRFRQACGAPCCS